MSEIEREQILSLRLEERQRAQDKANIDRLIKVQKGRQEENGGDSVSNAAKRGQIFSHMSDILLTSWP